VVPIEPWDKRPGHQGEARIPSFSGWPIDAALFAMIGEDCRRQLATRVTVDTGFVDKEISGTVSGKR